MRVSIDAGLLQMLRLALQRDAERGMQSRREMLEELDKDVQAIEEEPTKDDEHAKT